ncbi:DNA-binding protein [Paracoccus nototheniae]|uniref:DNA-binding protein n=1 Tax=Paracoccus nototheniae TaxID=2489002 RepID=A0ABW4DX73_9RHOB|nr:DNA-binding protein [Paracoccus nototheniae]
MTQKDPLDDAPPIDRWRLDDLLEPDRNLWGLNEIAQVASVSIDTVRRWHEKTDAPISKPGGRYFSTRNALKAWMKSR